MVAIALTGEVGAGKSTALNWFARSGVWTLSADSLVDELWTRPEILSAAARLWGDDVTAGGVIQRSLLAQRVFAAPDEQAKLCELLHPAVRAETERRLPSAGLAVVEIPLLFESGVPWWCEGVVFLRAPLDERSKRNSRRGLDEAELCRRGRFFWPSQQRAEASDWVIDNDGTEDQLIQKLSVLKEQWFLLDRLVRLEWTGNLEEARQLEKMGWLAGLSALVDQACEGRFVCQAFGLADRVKDLKLENLVVCRSFTLSCRHRQALIDRLAPQN